jgi:DNA mismatch endonuclease (patch repair protein)
LHNMGLRFRVDFPIRLHGTRPIRPDIVFTRRRTVVFCDGCFWHGCPEHGVRPTGRNRHYWAPKIAGNRERDKRHTSALHAAGWTVLRFWEHEDAEYVARRVAAVIATSGVSPSHECKLSDQLPQPFVEPHDTAGVDELP